MQTACDLVRLAADRTPDRLALVDRIPRTAMNKVDRKFAKVTAASLDDVAAGKAA